MPAPFHLILSPEAAADLEAIHQYISQDSPVNAAKLVGRILDAIETLDSFPHRNVVTRRSKRIKNPVRSLPIKPYVIYFRVLEQRQAVWVLTIRHGARQRPKRFG